MLVFGLSAVQQSSECKAWPGQVLRCSNGAIHQSNSTRKLGFTPLTYPKQLEIKVNLLEPFLKVDQKGKPERSKGAVATFGQIPTEQQAPQQLLGSWTARPPLKLRLGTAKGTGTQLPRCPSLGPYHVPGPFSNRLPFTNNRPCTPEILLNSGSSS